MTRIDEMADARKAHVAQEAAKVEERAQPESYICRECGQTGRHSEDCSGYHAEVKPQKTGLPKIPDHISYSIEHDNFYHIPSGDGQGSDFYDMWQHRKHEFPRWQGATSAKAEKAASGLHTMLTERGKRYGKFVDHARVTQEMKRIIYDELRRGDKLLQADQLEALDMIVHKLGRIVCGDPDYENSWRDIAGYATLVADRMKGEER